jgi:ferrous iron transport protein B
VTVEKKAGRFVHKGQTVEVVDLPGTYSLSAKALDELVARDFIVEEKPDVVVDIVDGTCLERNLYLTFLLLEIDANLVIALNRWDMVKSRALDIDLDRLSGLLGVPIVTTVATTGEAWRRLKMLSSALRKARKSQS